MARPTGIVCSDPADVMMNGQRKLFHEVTNVKIATAAVAGLASGIQICQ